jgi:hypothetical protein
MLARGNAKRHADLAFRFSSIYTAPFESAPVIMLKLVKIAVNGAGHPGHGHAQIRAGACSDRGAASPALQTTSRAAPGSGQYKIASRFLEAGIHLLSKISLTDIVRLLDICAACRPVLHLPAPLMRMTALRATRRANA